MKGRSALLLVAAASTFIVASACGSKKGHSNVATPTPTPPSVTSVVPASGLVGASVVVSGAHFGATQGSSTLAVGGKAATVSSWSDGAISATIPDLLPGAHAVSVTVAGASANASQSFTVTLPSIVYLLNSYPSMATNSSVSAFHVGSSGALTPIAGSPFDAGGQANSSAGGDSHPLIVDAAHRHLFAANDQSVAAFTIDGATGALTAVPGSPFAMSGTSPDYTLGLVVSADGAHLFASAYKPTGTSAIVGFDVATNGVLAPTAGSPFAVPASFAPDALVISSNGAGSCLLANDDLFPSVKIAGYPLTGGSLGTEVTSSKTGASVTLAGGAHAVYANAVLQGDFEGLSVGADCSVGDISGSPLVLPTNATASPSGIALHPAGTRAYVTNGNLHSLAIVDLDPATGALLGNNAASTFQTPSVVTPGFAMVSRDGAFLYEGDTGANKLYVFSLDSAGLPSPIGNVGGETGAYPLGAATLP